MSANVVLWYPTAIIICHCQAEKKVNLIVNTGFNNASMCGECGTLYSIKEISKELGPGGLPQVVISAVVPTPTGEVH